MKSESVDALIEELTERHGEDLPEAFTYATGVRHVAPVALGKGKKGNQFRLAVFGPSQALNDIIAEEVGSEVDVYTVDAKPRLTSQWVRQPRDILGINLQVGPRGFNWVGTGGIIVQAVEDKEILLQITNEHVTGEGAPRGRIMHQGGRDYGVVWKVGGLQFNVPQQWDVGSIAIDRGRKINAHFDHGWDDNLVGIRSMTEDDLGRRAANTGQTIGTHVGTCIAVGIRNLRVGYDGGVGTFNNQAAFAGEDGKPFSVGGHSGATIVMEDKYAAALLFAGGPDSQGRDITFAAMNLPGAIQAAGGIPSLP